MKTNLKLSVLVALLGLAIFICIPHTWAQDKDDKDEKGDKEKNEIKIGFKIAPVPLNLKHKDRDLVGLGSYIVNAQGGCNDCHTYPNYKDGGDPFLGQPEQINTDHYMAGGRPFGPVVSRLDIEQGLPSQLVFSVLSEKSADGAENVIAATNRGVVRYQSSQIAPTVLPARVISQRIHQSTELAQRLQLDYPQNSLLLDVTAISSRTFPEQFQYAFALYDGSGKIIGENLYQSPSGTGNDYYLAGKAVYTYSNGNMSQLDIHDFDQSGAETFTVTEKFQFDSKRNPLQFGNEGFAMGHPEWASANNITSGQLGDSNGPVDDQTMTVSYTYNNDDKPGTSTTTILPDNVTGNKTFYYQ